MRRRTVLCIVIVGLCASSMANSDIIIKSGTADISKQQANKQLVLAWLHDFWQGGNFDAWPKYMRADFVNHDPREPLNGAQALVDWLRERMSHNARPMKFPQPDHDHLFLIADGDLVMIGGIPGVDASNYNPDAWMTGISGNILRIQDGKIAEWWYYGGQIPNSQFMTGHSVLGAAPSTPPPEGPPQAIEPAAK
jgi:predicted SnoaL-like aldol condensation-catalyzing enzyme